ncbi:arginine ABC transporter substrate-binding protein [Parasalinivibrio latis]|uniref:arginine ABC transporter substrate-binding protein n=1 Tax=Parasalinivibrio latis TaxID=2952610 RepID=UPI0030E12B3C
MKLMPLVVLLSSVMTAGAAQAESIKFAMEATYPPFEYTNDKNELVGFDVDVANALCVELKAECSFHNQAFDSLIPALKFRRYDAAISAMDITAERLEQVAFSDAYYDNSASFISADGKFSDTDALKGKRVGVQNGSTHQKYITEQLPGVEAVPYASYQNAFIDMKNGRIDAVFGDTAVVAEWLKKDDALATVGKPVTDTKYFGQGFGIAVNQENQELVKKLNQALASIQKDGTYKTIYDKWFQ